MRLLKFGSLLMLLAVLAGCVKQRPDEPPAGGSDPKGVSANISIKDLRDLYTIGSGAMKEITNDYVIMGVVNADDKDGNLYKVITIQDSSAGIQIKVDQTSLYNDYPVGRRVFVKCKGLYLGEYNGLVQLGGYIDYSSGSASLGGIASTLVAEKVLKGKYNIPLVAKLIQITDLDLMTYQSMLVRFDNVEFLCQDANQAYADNVNKASINHSFQDCSGNQGIIRTSGYANFAASKTATGNGTLLGIYTPYKSSFGFDKQITIRNTNDVKMTTPTRCDGTIISANVVDFATLRSWYAGSDVIIPCGTRVRGVVVSDLVNGNFSNKNLSIQDGTGGIVFYFSAGHTFNQGDSVEVSVGGMTLKMFSGELELAGGATSAVSVIQTGVTPPARVATLADINANIGAWGNTLVRVNNVTLTNGTGTYNGNVTLTDNSGTLTLYTRSAANFSASTLPSGQKTITGVVSKYNSTIQMAIRSLGDVQ